MIGFMENDKYDLCYVYNKINNLILKILHMNFNLDQEELEKLSKWRKNLPKLPQECLNVFGEEFQYTFKFQPTGLGVVKIVEREYDNQVINLTSFDDW